MKRKSKPTAAANMEKIDSAGAEVAELPSSETVIFMRPKSFESSESSRRIPHRNMQLKNKRALEQLQAPTPALTPNQKLHDKQNDTDLDDDYGTFRKTIHI